MQEDFTIQLPVTAVQFDGSKSYVVKEALKVIIGCYCGTTPLNILNATTATPSIFIEPGMYKLDYLLLIHTDQETWQIYCESAG